MSKKRTERRKEISLKSSDRLGAQSSPGTGVWLERDAQVATWSDSSKAKGPCSGLASLQAPVPRVGLGQRGRAGRRSTRRCPVTRPDSAKRRRGGGSSLGRLLPAALTG